MGRLRAMHFKGYFALLTCGWACSSRHPALLRRTVPVNTALQSWGIHIQYVSPSQTVSGAASPPLLPKPRQ